MLLSCLHYVSLVHSALDETQAQPSLQTAEESGQICLHQNCSERALLTS